MSEMEEDRIASRAAAQVASAREKAAGARADGRRAGVAVCERALQTAALLQAFWCLIAWRSLAKAEAENAALVADLRDVQNRVSEVSDEVRVAEVQTWERAVARITNAELSLEAMRAEEDIERAKHPQPDGQQELQLQAAQLADLSVQVRQLAEWASEGSRLRVRVAYVVWRGFVHKSRRLQLMDARYETHSRKLDAVMTQALFAQWRGMSAGKAISTVAKMMADRDEEEDASATAARLMQFAGVPRQADLQTPRGYGALSMPAAAASSSRSGGALSMASSAGLHYSRLLTEVPT